MIKKISGMLLIVFVIACPAYLFAASRIVTISWQMSNVEGVQGYKVYYDTNSSMIDKVLINTCNAPVQQSEKTYTITCNDVQIEVDMRYYFCIGAQMESGTESLSDVFDKKYITPVNNLSIIKK